MCGTPVREDWSVVIGGKVGCIGVCEETEGDSLGVCVFGSKSAASAMHWHVRNRWRTEVVAELYRFRSIRRSAISISIGFPFLQSQQSRRIGWQLNRIPLSIIWTKTHPLWLLFYLILFVLWIGVMDRCCKVFYARIEVCWHEEICLCWLLEVFRPFLQICGGKWETWWIEMESVS